MPLVPPKKNKYSFELKEGIDVPKAITIPVTVDGVDASANVDVKLEGVVKPAKGEDTDGDDKKNKKK